MKRVLCCIVFICLVLTLACGCAQKKVVKKKVVQPDPALKKIESAAKDIQSELEKLSKMRMSYKQVKAFEAPKTGPLAKKMTLTWSGPLRDVLKVVSNRIGYSFRVTGEAPASPVLVTIDKTDATAFTVLEDIGWKAGRHNVNVDAGKRIVQLTYFREARTELDG